MGEIVDFDGFTRLDIDPDRVLDQAIGKLDSVLLIGWEKGEDGRQYVASSTANGAELVWMLELAKKRLIDG